MTDPTEPLLPIGWIESPHVDPDRTPRQASADAHPARVVVDPRYADGLLGLDRYRYVWVLTWLDRQPDRRPLQLVPCAEEAGGALQGVFASRAPVRPNPIGLSLVRCVGLRDNVVAIEGIDLLDGTPVLDLKPWFADCDLPEASAPGRGREPVGE